MQQSIRSVLNIAHSRTFISFNCSLILFRQLMMIATDPSIADLPPESPDQDAFMKGAADIIIALHWAETVWFHDHTPG